MAATVLNSPRATEMSIVVVRVFVRFRQLLQSNVHLARKIDALERKCDGKFGVVLEAIRELMAPPASTRKRIGFRA